MAQLATAPAGPVPAGKNLSGPNLTGPNLTGPKRSNPGGSDTIPQRKPRTPWKSWLLFLLFAGPNVGLLIIFTYKPLIQSLQYSLLQWNIGSATARFIGLDNYVSWFSDPTTANVVRVTVIFTVATVGGGMVLGLSLALLLNRKLRGTGLARTVVVAPYVLSGVAVGLLWLFVFDPNFGVLGAMLGAMGLSSPDWYNDPTWALPMLIVVYLWKNVGYVALVYLAALQAVPRDLIEAATLDGAGAFASLKNVVLPLLGPTTFFLSVTTLLSSLQSFDIIQAMTQGGPLEGTTTMMYQIYREGFATGRAGYSSAIATVLFVVLLIITAVQMLFVQKKVHY